MNALDLFAAWIVCGILTIAILSYSPADVTHWQIRCLIMGPVGLFFCLRNQIRDFRRALRGEKPE